MTISKHGHHKFSLTNNLSHVGRVAQSVQRLTTGWTIWGSNPDGARFFACPVRPCKMGRGLSRGKVRPGRTADHSPPSSAAVMEV